MWCLVPWINHFPRVFFVHFLEISFFNSSWSVSLTKRKRFCHFICCSVYIYSNISKYNYTLFLFALFSRIKLVLFVAKYPCTAIFHGRSLDYLSLIILPGKSCGKLKTIHLSALSANNCVLFFFLIKLCSFWCAWQKSSLRFITAWCRTGEKPLSNQCWPCLLNIYVTRPSMLREHVDGDTCTKVPQVDIVTVPSYKLLSTLWK